jgi:hypothetical protein
MALLRISLISDKGSFWTEMPACSAHDWQPHRRREVRYAAPEKRGKHRTVTRTNWIRHCTSFDFRFRASRQFGLQHLSRVEQDHSMQTAAVRAIIQWIAKDADAVARLERISRPPKTHQDGRAAGLDIPFERFTAASGFEQQRECRMRIAPLESLDCPFERAYLSRIVCGERMMREGRQRHERRGTQ